MDFPLGDNVCCMPACEAMTYRSTSVTYCNVLLSRSLPMVLLCIFIAYEPFTTAWSCAVAPGSHPLLFFTTSTAWPACDGSMLYSRWLLGIISASMSVALLCCFFARIPHSPQTTILLELRQWWGNCWTAGKGGGEGAVSRNCWGLSSAPCLGHLHLLT